ncbi:MAG: hypothetical protein RLZZ142_1998, partial [Verrucomicrobiota bacterium]
LVSGGSVTGGVPVTRIDPSAGSASTQVTLMANAQGDLIDGGAYQWFVYRSASRAWQPIPGAVDSLLTLSGAQRVHDTYYRVTAYGKVGGGVDSAPLRLLVNENVSFDRNLRRQTITLAEGDNATLGVNVNGYQPRYEWRFTGTGPSTVVASGTVTGSLTGGTLLTYPIVNAGTVHAGTYSVTLWNGFTDPVTRDIAVVSVRTAPRFSDPNLAVGGNAVSESLGFARVAEGGSVSLTASLGTGCAPFTYQWRRDGRLLPATAGLQTSGSFAVDQPSLQVSFPASAADSGIYDLVLSNNWGSVVTRPVSLAVDRRPFIVTQPAPASAAENGSANFSVEAVGAGTLSYAWFMSGSNGFARSGSSVVLDGATLVGNTRLLARTNLSASSSGREFAVQVSTDYPGLAPVVSQAAKLTVTRPGDFTVAISGTLNGSPLAGSSVSPGASLGFTATVSGSGSFSYQWRKNGLVLPGKVGSTLSIPSVLGDTGGAYDVVATDGANFAYSAPLIVEVDPRIDAFDVPASVNPGDGVKLSVTAVTASGRTLSYKWFKGTTLLSSGNSSTLTIASASASDAGDYSVEVTSTQGGASSALRSVTKAMTVNGVVSITSQPEGGILASQRPLSLSVGALNATSYQWYRTLVSTGVRTKLVNGSGISGATSSTLNLISVTESDSGVYQVEVSNSGGSVTSAPAKVQVLPPLSVTLNSLPVTPVGGGVNLVASVQGAESPVYAWYFTPSAGGARTRLQGQNADRLKLNPVAVENDGNYEVEVQDGARSVSANTTLSVLRVPEIVVAPVSQAVLVGATANFGVVARFNGALRYSWYFGSDRSNPIGSASQIKLRNVVAEQFGTYTVRVEDASNPAAYVEVSARLTQKTDPGLNNSTRVSRGWWVYGVTGTADNPANNRSGFFVQERNKDSNGKITAGKSAWFWLTASASTVDDWSVANQTVTEAADSTRSEYSIVADRDSFGELESFVISGLVEAGAAASIFGAPDLMEGDYQVGVPLFLEMSWDDAGRSAVELLGESATLDSATGKELIRDVLRQILGLPMGGGGSQTPSDPLNTLPTSGAEED